MKSTFMFLAAFITLGNVQLSAQGITVHVSSHVEYVITDSLQRRAGFDPRSNQRYTEINNSYGVFSIDSEDPNVEPPEPVNEFMTHDPVDGKYHLKLYGTRLAVYSAMIAISRGPSDGKTFNVKGVIDSNDVQEYEFRYSSIPGTPFQAAKTTGRKALRQDFENCYKLMLLGDHSLHKEIGNRIAQLERQLERKDTAKANEGLEKLAGELKKVREETVKHESRDQVPKRFIRQEAFDILTEDILNITSSLSPAYNKDKTKQ